MTNRTGKVESLIPKIVYHQRSSFFFFFFVEKGDFCLHHILISCFPWKLWENEKCEKSTTANQQGRYFKHFISGFLLRLHLY